MLFSLSYGISDTPPKKYYNKGSPITFYRKPASQHEMMCYIIYCVWFQLSIFFTHHTKN